MSTNASHGGFADTNWTLIEELRATDPARRERALDALYRIYQSPVYAFLRQQGCDPELARDLTQAFFVEKVIDGRLFETADPTRARLRVLLCVALRNFRIDEGRREIARRRYRDRPTVNIDLEEMVMADEDPAPADDAFQRRWASVVLEEALRRGAEHYHSRGLDRTWNAFYARTVRPILSGSAPIPMADIADEVGLPSAADVSRAVFQVKRRLHIIMLAVVAETVGSPDAAADELREVLGTLGGAALWDGAGGDRG